MSEAETIEELEREDLNIFLQRAEVEMSIAKGIKIDRSESKENTVIQMRIERPGSYDETPDVYFFIKTVPHNVTQSTTTELKMTYTELDPNIDVKHHTHNVIFSTQPNVIGGNPKTTITDSFAGYHGTRTIYSDSDTPSFGTDVFAHPLLIAKGILGKLKAATIPLQK